MFISDLFTHGSGDTFELGRAAGIIEAVTAAGAVLIVLFVTFIIVRANVLKKNEKKRGENE
ncbi:MAG: hypothetical protein IJS78_00900 [Clostridia bacterium]|nr:hypothetical protein [Clostridia bacterium]